MASPLRDKNEIKIFILFLLDKIGYPLPLDTIGSIVVEDGIVRYFDFADCFYQLIDAHHIRRAESVSAEVDGEDKGKELYEITESGREVAHVLGENLMITVREQGERSAVRHLSLKKLGATIDQSYEVLSEGYAFHCSIRDKNGDMLSLTTRLDDRRMLERVQKNFADRPEVIYRGILALLSGDVNYIFE